MSLPEFEARLEAVEARVERTEARVERAVDDAAAARHLAAARDRDLADFATKIDANRKAINALGVQTAARFEQMDRRFDRLENEMRTGFANVRHLHDQTTGALTRIIALLERHPGGAEA